jgi:hypothetical protein
VALAWSKKLRFRLTVEAPSCAKRALSAGMRVDGLFSGSYFAQLTWSSMGTIHRSIRLFSREEYHEKHRNAISKFCSNLGFWRNNGRPKRHLAGFISSTSPRESSTAETLNRLRSRFFCFRFSPVEKLLYAPISTSELMA